MKKFLILFIIVLTGCTYVIEGEIGNENVYLEVRPYRTTPTKTVQPSPTVSPTTTPTEIFIPTQEGTKVTPAPTATIVVTNTPEPTSFPGVCFGRVNTAALNVRKEPNLKAAIIGQVYRGDILHFETFIIDTSGNLWREIWYGFDELGGKRNGWVSNKYIDLDPSSECGTSFGVIAVQDPNKGDAITMGNTLKARGIQPAVTVVFDCNWGNDLYDLGWFVLCRPFHQQVRGDCPDISLDARESARIRVSNVISWAGSSKYHMLQISNECGGWPSAVYLRDWMDEVITQCLNFNIKCVPVMWATGHLEINWLETLRPVYQRMNQVGMCQGRNLYPAMSGVLLSEVNEWTNWTTWRFRLDRQVLGNDTPCMIVSEAGQEDQTGVNLEDYALFASKIKGEARAVTFWVVSTLPYPQNFNGHMWELGQRIISAF